ncbi:hypothetical protein CPB84DRAFT_1722695 [Gymnopilus junonius]|uniref:Peptidase C15, pyroglutamyl peptidase I-like protein n=1 Tax=Gymnopilus junonius TaxID=109634 RepID=A0A9P5NCV4_GYMJU|nr:hypothetical protein CPB84DRAFT_1689298 [Gymnopilus junonius]KAF8912253.1 hypothetical protein CPB84DRAFT_1722695 [Gymnopilus junonius]
MTPVPQTQEDVVAAHNVPQNAFRVLVTGFGPFLHYEENPSWLAVKPLQNIVLHTNENIPRILPLPSATSSNLAPIPDEGILDGTKPRPIHVTTLKIPVTYDAVLSTVPGLHARPPILPAGSPAECARPPASNYDFIFHIGVAGRGPLRMERQAHKLGYHMKDATGKLAPVVRHSAKDFSRRDGARYETSPDEITTDIDVTRLVHDLKRSGIDQIYTSMDAGHYLCDFIYYCSLEVKRASKPYEKRRNTQVLFLHCPPVSLPLSTEEVTDAIKRIVVWVCNEQQLLDVKEDAAAGGTAASSGPATGGATGAVGVTVGASAPAHVAA